MGIAYFNHALLTLHIQNYINLAPSNVTHSNHTHLQSPPTKTTPPPVTAYSNHAPSPPGTTRDTFGSKQVKLLRYECYESMAVKQMKAEICRPIRNKWPEVHSIAIVHRLG